MQAGPVFVVEDGDVYLGTLGQLRRLTGPPSPDRPPRVPQGWRTSYYTEGLGSPPGDGAR